MPEALKGKLTFELEDHIMGCDYEKQDRKYFFDCTLVEKGTNKPKGMLKLELTENSCISLKKSI